MKDWKTNYIVTFAKKVRDFNLKHKALSPITICLTLVWIFLISFTIGIFDAASKRRKVVIPVAAILIVVILVVAFNNYSQLAMSDESVSEVSFESIEAQIAGSQAEGTLTEEETGTSEASTAENDSEVAAQASSEEISKEETAAEGVSSEESSEVASAEEASTDESSVMEAAEGTPAAELSEVSSMYPEAVAWLYFEDGSISYPIMQSGDNTKYLTTGYDGEEAWEGSIFLDYRSANDFSDASSVVYGHNMKDGTMFGAFKKYKFDSNFPEYYNGHKYFQIITPTQTYRYQIFAFMDIDKEDEIFELLGDKSGELINNIEHIKKHSYISSNDLTFDESSKIVILSTCTQKDPTSFVVCGVRIDE